ncbi:MAG: hypothetical protein ABFE13_12565 [Phycisphaerales bacterium]
MSLVLIPREGHLDVLLLYEQHYPELSNGQLCFTLCYDIVFRYYGKDSLSAIGILSQHKPAGVDSSSPRVFDLLPYAGTERFNWIFSAGTDILADEATLCLPPLVSGPTPLAYRVTRLHPKIDAPAWTVQNGSRKAGSAVRATGLTHAIVYPADEVAIRPYNFKEPEKTTYWLRLCFQPMINYDLPAAMLFNLPGGSPLTVQPYSILGQQAILESLNDQLEKLSHTEEFGGHAQEAKRLMFEKTFCRNGTGAAVRDHRISLLRSKDFLLLNTHLDGPCGFVNIEPALSNGGAAALTWISGNEKYWETDPLAMSRQVYLHMKDWALTEAEAKTKEQISTAVSPMHHYNISFVVEGLKKLGFVRERVEGCASYCTDRARFADDGLIVERYEDIAQHHPLDDVLLVLDTLYGNLPVPAQKKGVSRFQRVGFRVQVELGFIPAQRGRTANGRSEENSLQT